MLESANFSKSEVFFSGLQGNLKQQILNILKFKEGHLLVTYLGVPLISGKLKHQDCLPLLTKITARINSWSSKMLSLAGRLQLIQSVLFSVHAYWSNVFILPKSTIKELEQKLSSFLWKGTERNGTG